MFVKHKISRLISSVITALALALSLLVFTPTPAQAGHLGCAGRVADYVLQTVNDVWYPTSIPRPPFTKPHKLRFVTTTTYHRCTTLGTPSGRIVNGPIRVRPKFVDYCWTFLAAEEHFWFKGVTANLFFYDDEGRNVNPPRIKIKDDVTVQNCRHQDVPLTDYSAPRTFREIWFNIENAPKVKGFFTVNLQDPGVDPSFLIKAKTFNMKRDWRIRPYHW